MRRGRRRKMPLFRLMLTAFITVIMLGMCGMGSVFVIAARISGQGSSGPPWSTPPLVGTVTVNGTPVALEDHDLDGWNSRVDWRGPVGALLAFTGVLVGAATFFSKRMTMPLTRLTEAAQTMSDGNLSVRVGPSSVREIDELAGAFNTMAASLSDADRQRRQMTADVAHELRTPLSIIRGRLEGMQDGVYGATPDQISTLLSETALLERLIEDLRVLALADAGQLPLFKESIAPLALLAGVARSFAQGAQEAGVRLEAAPVSARLPEVEADPQRISQVLGNLVANALRHTPSGGSVRLDAVERVGEEGREIVVSVSDTGSGIAPQDLPHIFDRFYRADPSRTRAAGGAGLGLAITKRIIEAHGGMIWAESAPGSGTTVSFSLPVQASGE
jgi:signal transduction histidine kinase